jgi:FkbM family methyltransferase
MGRLRAIARAIRHAPGLRHADWLWDRVRPAYHAVLNRDRRGVAVTIGGNLPVRMPAEFTGLGYESYEVECVRALSDWVQGHPDGTLLDVGCSIAVFSLAGLTLSPELRVIAFDADLASLKATRRLCEQAGGTRLRLVHGLLTETHPSAQTLDAAVTQTAESLRAAPGDGDPRSITYVYLNRQSADGPVPRHSLDGLLGGATPSGRPLLLKCDVEGAELLVLRGARRLLSVSAPDLLVSVHPDLLPAFGHSAEGVRRYLHELGYAVRVLGVDHEEHWWCSRPAG